MSVHEGGEVTALSIMGLDIELQPCSWVVLLSPNDIKLLIAV